VARSDDRDLYSGLISLHVLNHAAEEPIFGQGMLEELGRHGYRLSPGTLYPNSARSRTKGLSLLDRKALAAGQDKIRECDSSRVGELLRVVDSVLLPARPDACLEKMRYIGNTVKVELSQKPHI
jgi:hypothetical protein